MMEIKENVVLGSSRRAHVIAIGALLAVLLALVPGISCAGDAIVVQADELLRAGRADEAYRLLEPLESERAGDQEFDYLLGLAAVDSGHAGRGMFALERVLAVNPNHPQARAEIARAHFMLGEHESARQEFNNALDRHPPEAAIATINRYMSAIDRALGETTRFGAFLELTWGRDSNINGAPSAQSFTANIGGMPLPVTLTGNAAEKSDTFVNMSGGANFQHPLNKNLTLFGGVMGNNRVNWSSGMFETSSLDFNLGLRRALGPNTITAVLQDGTFDLDGAAYRRAYGVTAQWQHDLDDRNQVNVYGQATRLKYPSAAMRDADRKLLGVGYGHAFLGDLSPVIFMSAYAGSEDERSSGHPDLGHRLHGLKAGGQVTWNPKTVLFASAGYERRDYGGTKPFFTESQQDRQYDVAIGARYLPMARWQIKPQLSYLVNNSNIPITDYDRLMLSITFRHDFEW